MKQTLKPSGFSVYWLLSFTSMFPPSIQENKTHFQNKNQQALKQNWFHQSKMKTQKAQVVKVEGKLGDKCSSKKWERVFFQGESLVPQNAAPGWFQELRRPEWHSRGLVTALTDQQEPPALPSSLRVSVVNEWYQLREAGLCPINVLWAATHCKAGRREGGGVAQYANCRWCNMYYAFSSYNYSLFTAIKMSFLQLMRNSTLVCSVHIMPMKLFSSWKKSLHTSSTLSRFKETSFKSYKHVLFHQYLDPQDSQTLSCS